MKKQSIKNIIRNSVLALVTFLMLGCNGGTVIQKQEVSGVPSAQYERIIKLDNPQGTPDKTLAGLVFIKKGAKVCTDYYREETIKSLDDLAPMEKNAFNYFSNYAIKAGNETFGFVSIPIENRIVIWENKKDSDCLYKVQIILPESTKENDGTGMGIGSQVK